MKIFKKKELIISLAEALESSLKTRKNKNSNKQCSLKPLIYKAFRDIKTNKTELLENKVKKDFGMAKNDIKNRSSFWTLQEHWELLKKRQKIFLGKK